MGTRSDVHKQFSNSKLPKPAYINLLPFCINSVNFMHKNKPTAIAGRRLICHYLHFGCLNLAVIALNQVCAVTLFL